MARRSTAEILGSDEDDSLTRREPEDVEYSMLGNITLTILHRYLWKICHAVYRILVMENLNCAYFISLVLERQKITF